MTIAISEEQVKFIIGELKSINGLIDVRECINLLSSLKPSPWIKAIDEALLMHHLGVVDDKDDYQKAKEKLNSLLCAQQEEVPNVFQCWWAMCEAQAKIMNEVICDTDVVLSFMGSGASCNVTAGVIRTIVKMGKPS